MQDRTRLLVLSAECAAIFIATPLLMLYLRDRPLMFAVLWLAAIPMFLFIHAKKPPVALPLREEVKRIALRFAVLAPIITLATWLIVPDIFLSFPLERPERWIMVMFLYPILSVWPQEVLYRHYFCTRYIPLWGDGRVMVLASALAFGFMHVILLNWVAVIMTAIGGLIFAESYRKYRSLTLVCIEHAMYGGLVFTLGLGVYFYTGYAWK